MAETTTNNPDSEAGACGFAGDSDLYGLGIRVGFYQQWIATLLVTLFRPEDEKMFCVVNVLIQVALLSILALAAAQRTLRVAEAMIAFWLMCGPLASVTGDGENPIGTITGTVRLSLYAGLSGFGLWFWLGGLDDLAPQPCEPVVFFGGTTAPTGGWFRRVGQVVSATGIAVCAGLAMWSVVWIIVRRGRRLRRNLLSRQRTDISLALLSVGILVVSISATEYLLRANGIREVNVFFGAGQLIPFLIGMFSLISVVFSTAVEKSYERTRCWVVFGKHLT